MGLDFTKSTFPLHGAHQRFTGVDLRRSFSYCWVLLLSSFAAGLILSNCLSLGPLELCMMSILVSCLLAVGAHWFIAKAHWRFADGTIFIAGLLSLGAHLFSFYPQMIEENSGQWLYRIDRLPVFVAHKMREEPYRAAHLPARRISVTDQLRYRLNSLDYTPPMNWAFFTFLIFITIPIPLIAARLRAQRFYCDTCRNWMRQSVVSVCDTVGHADDIDAFVPPIDDPTLADLIDRNDFHRIGLIRKDDSTPIDDVIVIDFCAGSKCSLCRTYFSMLKQDQLWKSGHIFSRVGQHEAIVADQVLTEDQMTALLPLFPELRHRVPKDAYEQFWASRDREINRINERRKQHFQACPILIEDFPEDRALTPLNRTIGLLLHLLPLLLGILSFCVFLAWFIFIDQWKLELAIRSGWLRTISVAMIPVLAATIFCGAIYHLPRKRNRFRLWFYKKLMVRRLNQDGRVHWRPTADFDYIAQIRWDLNHRSPAPSPLDDIGWVGIDRIERTVCINGCERRAIIPLAAITRGNFERPSIVLANDEPIYDRIEFNDGNRIGCLKALPLFSLLDDGISPRRASNRQITTGLRDAIWKYADASTRPRISDAKDRPTPAIDRSSPPK